MTQPARHPEPISYHDFVRGAEAMAAGRLRTTAGQDECPLTDLGNAERLVRDHGADLRFLAPARQWLVWDGKRCARDETLEIFRRAKDTVRGMYAEAAALADSSARKALADHARKSESDYRIRAMIGRAESEPGITVVPSDLDQDPWLLNVENGAINLRTGELRPHRREDLITKLAHVTYNPKATAPRWRRFVREIMGGDPELVAFLQRAVGYSLTGDVREECLFLLYGMGSNGKSKFLETVRALVGGYAKQADFGTFLEQRHDRPRPDIARLCGARVVTAIEVGESGQLSDNVVKSLTGGDTITARELYAREFEFRPQLKLWFAANHKPAIRAADHAMWRRICLVPFTQTFNPPERDLLLAEKLRAELPGILRWALAGCREWRKQGLRPPAGVRVATEEYRVESDTIGAFVAECCDVDSKAQSPAGHLYKAYVTWAQENGERPVSGTAFGRRLTERGFGPDYDSRRNRVRLGIRLRAHTPHADGPEGWNGAHNISSTRASTEDVGPELPNHPEPSGDSTPAGHNGVARPSIGSDALTVAGFVGRAI
jgi:putative DNA primase/helicase